MRFSSAAIAAPLVLLTSSVFADTCTCPSNQGAVAQAATSFNDGASQPYVYTPPPVVQVPSVPATQKNLNNGAQKALDNMAAQGVIPASGLNLRYRKKYHVLTFTSHRPCSANCRCRQGPDRCTGCSAAGRVCRRRHYSHHYRHTANYCHDYNVSRPASHCHCHTNDHKSPSRCDHPQQ